MNWGIDWLITMPALTVLSLLTFIDIVFGSAVAWARKEVSSAACLLGMLKKSAMFVAVSVGMCVEILYLNYSNLMPFDMPKVAPITVLIALGFCWMEIVSIGEKFKRSGVRLPSIMVWFLDRLKQSTTGPADYSALKLPTLNFKVESDIVKAEADRVAQLAAERAARRAEVRAGVAVHRAEEKVEQVVHGLEEIRDAQREDSQILKATHDTVAQLSGDIKQQES